jgi:hypothetical protein
MKTLNREEIYANEYRDLDHLRENVAAFIDSYYNRSLTEPDTECSGLDGTVPGGAALGRHGGLSEGLQGWQQPENEDSALSFSRSLTGSVDDPH